MVDHINENVLMSLQMSEGDNKATWGSDTERDEEKENQKPTENKDSKKPTEIKDNKKPTDPRRRSSRNKEGGSPEKESNQDKTDTVVDQLKKEKIKLQNTVQALTKERNNLKGKCKTLQDEAADNDELQEEIDDLKTKQKQLQTDMDKVVNEKNELDKQITNYCDQSAVISDLHDEILARDTQITLLNERLSEETQAKMDLAQAAIENGTSNDESQVDKRQRLLLITDEKNNVTLMNKMNDSKYIWNTLEDVNKVEDVKDLSDDHTFIKKLSSYHGIIIMLGGYDIIYENLSPNTVNDQMKDVISVVYEKTKSYIAICETPPATLDQEPGHF